MTRAELLYLTGSGHSGSTVLSVALGGHPAIASLGEIHRLSMSVHGADDLHRCTCGATVPECPYWQAVDDALRTKRDGEGLTALMTTDPSFLELRQVGSYLERPSRRPVIASRPNQAALVLGHRPLWRALSYVERGARVSRRAAIDSMTLFDAVAGATGAKVIVDATKNPGRLKALWFERGAREMRVLRLVRDGRAVVASRVRREGVTVDRAAKIWRQEHLKQAAALRTIPDARIRTISYEALTEQPCEVLKETCSWLGLAFEPTMLELDAGSRHIVGGNPVRFYLGGEDGFRADTRWRHELNDQDLRRFDAVAGKVNRQLGY